jgi:hypothetical protein
VDKIESEVNSVSVWHRISDVGAGYAFSLSEAAANVEATTPGILVPVDAGPMILASDYSGQHRDASHEAYSFLVTCEPHLHEWFASLQAFRAEWLPDGRRLCFKKLNEPMRWRALPAFLQTVGALRGNAVTILVDRRVGSFFGGDTDAMINGMPDSFPSGTRPGTVEKMFRHATCVALIQAALRREGQQMFWISDHDETLDSHDRREAFARLASYLSFGFTKWLKPADSYFTTTESPQAPQWAEDVASVADLLAGAYCSMSAALPAYFTERSWLVSISSQNLDRRAQAIGNWLASPKSLRNILLRLEVDQHGEVRATAQAFLSTKMPLPAHPR